ncbi:hypothetical protein [Streptomyces sp. NPDC058394]
MLQHGMTVSHETLRRWCPKPGHAYTDEPRRRRPGPGDGALTAP